MKSGRLLCELPFVPHTHSHKDMNNREGKGALVKLQLPTICTISAPRAPSDVWALLGLEMVISLSNTHSAVSAFQINTQKITSSAYPDTHSSCSPPLSLSLSLKKPTPLWIMTKLVKYSSEKQLSWQSSCVKYIFFKKKKKKKAFTETASANARLKHMNC